MCWEGEEGEEEENVCDLGWSACVEVFLASINDSYDADILLNTQGRVHRTRDGLGESYREAGSGRALALPARLASWSVTATERVDRSARARLDGG